MRKRQSPELSEAPVRVRATRARRTNVYRTDFGSKVARAARN